MFIYICVYLCIYLHMYIHTRTNMCIHVYISMFIYRYTHICMYPSPNPPKGPYDLNRRNPSSLQTHKGVSENKG